MNNSTSHSLAVKTPLSRLYLALFSAPLLLFLPADVARAADAFFDGDSRITETLGYTGDVYVGRNQRGNLLIDNGKITAYNINIGRLFDGKIYESVVTVRGPDAELNAVNDRYVLRGDLNRRGRAGEREGDRCRHHPRLRQPPNRHGCRFSCDQ